MSMHQIKTFAVKDGKPAHEIYRETFRTAEEAHSAYIGAIDNHNSLPEKFREPLMVARYADGRMMAMRIL